MGPRACSASVSVLAVLQRLQQPARCCRNSFGRRAPRLRLQSHCCSFAFSAAFVTLPFLGLRGVDFRNSSGADASRNVTLLGWQRWTHLDRGCFDVATVAAMDASRSRMLLGIRRYLGGSDGRISIADTSGNPSLPRWPRSRCF